MNGSEAFHRPALAFGESRAPLRPLRFAIVVTVLYALFAALWIVFSSELAARLAASVVDLRDIELGKGILFVLATSTMLFVALLLLGRRVRERELRILTQDEALVLAERSALAGIFAASVAHDVNNALAVALAGVDELGEGVAEQLRRPLQAIRELNERLAQMGNERQGREERFDLSLALGREVGLARRHALVRDCDLRLFDEGPVWLRGVRSLVGRAVLNLILNAAEATGGRGRIEVAIHPDGEGVTISVDDDGPGIPPEQRQRVFRPFFTSKPDGNGLGLMSVLACAQRHEGSAHYRGSALGGARFEIRLPAARMLESPAALQDVEPATEGR